jgi:uncharacterized protein (DUF427 family)
VFARDPVGPGQESVWDFPRPARAERVSCRLRIVHRGEVVAETCDGVRTLETSHPPSYYFPPDAVAPGILRRSRHGSFCEWKGQASYFDVVIAGETLTDVGWSYAAPTNSFAILRDHLAFYAAPFDACFVDGEKVVPQPGGFYGGWITSRLAGPFKGIPGSRFW